MSQLPGPRRAYQDHLRYKHMVARLSGLRYYQLENAVLAELAKGRRWRIDAALEALSQSDERYMGIDYVGVFRTAGRYGRLTAMQRLVDIYQSEKIDRASNPHGACSHGILDAFDAAATAGHYRVARFLLPYGAKPDYLLGNQRPQRAMFIAIEEGDMAKVDFLLACGANPSYHLSRAVYCKNMQAAERFIAASADLNVKPEGRMTALHQAARSGDMAMVDLLLARGADVAACASDMLYDVMQKGNEAVFDRLLAAGVMPVAHDLEKAVAEGQLDYARKIVNAGVPMKPEYLLHAVGSTKRDDKMIALCLSRGVTAEQALAHLERQPDLYRYSGTGKREQIAAILRELAVTRVSARGPKI